MNLRPRWAQVELAPTSAGIKPGLPVKPIFKVMRPTIEVRMISFTKEAEEKIISLIEPGQVLRLRVTGGGCSGLRYNLSFEDIILDDVTLGDTYYEDNFTYVLDTKTEALVDGLVVSYDNSLNGKGFEYSNPNATASCGCGISFSA